MIFFPLTHTYTHTLLPAKYTTKWRRFTGLRRKVNRSSTGCSLLASQKVNRSGKGCYPVCFFGVLALEQTTKMATTKHVESIIDNNGKAREVEVFVFHNPSKRKRENKEEVSRFNAVKTKQNKQQKQRQLGMQFYLATLC